VVVIGAAVLGGAVVLARRFLVAPRAVGPEPAPPPPPPA
jgi:hypothetical protein